MLRQSRWQKLKIEEKPICIKSCWPFSWILFQWRRSLRGRDEVLKHWPLAFQKSKLISFRGRRQLYCTDLRTKYPVWIFWILFKGYHDINCQSCQSILTTIITKCVYCLPVAASKLTKVPATSQKNCFPIKLCYQPAPFVCSIRTYFL